MRREPACHIFQVRFGSRLFPYGGHPPVRETARVDVVEPTQVRIHVERETVHRHVARRTYSDCGYFPHRAAFGQPHPRRSCDTGTADAVVGYRPYDRFLNRVDILLESDALAFEVEYGIAHQLSRAVERDVPSPVYAVERCTFAFEEIFGHKHVLFMAAFAQRIDRRMFAQQQILLRFPSVSALGGQQVVEKLFLQFPAAGIIHNAQVAANHSLLRRLHGQSSFRKLSRASSAM